MGFDLGGWNSSLKEFTLTARCRYRVDLFTWLANGHLQKDIGRLMTWAYVPSPKPETASNLEKRPQTGCHREPIYLLTIGIARRQRDRTGHASGTSTGRRRRIRSNISM